MSKAYTPHTPQKQPKISIRNQIIQPYLRSTPESTTQQIVAGAEHGILKDCQSLKIQVRQLQAKNNSLVAQMQQILHQKTYTQSKYRYKINVDDQVINEYSKQKNYQMELLQIKHEEEVNRLKRQSELKNDQHLREVKHKEYQIREKDQQNRYLEMRNQELRKDYQTLSIQFTKSRQQNSMNTETITRNEYAIKKLEMLIQESELQKAEMETEIRTLLDIQDQKSIALSTLETQLKNSEQNQRRLMDKLTVLSQNFVELESHISAMKQKLINEQQNNMLMSQKIQRLQQQINEKQKQLMEHLDTENVLKIELDEFSRREVKREREVGELMEENQQLYKELNLNRHRLHDFAVNYGLDI